MILTQFLYFIEFLDNSFKAQQLYFYQLDQKKQSSAYNLIQNMFQITNATYRFRKRKLVSKTGELFSFNSETRADSHPNYLQIFKNTQHIPFNTSLPKNIKILPKLEKTFQYISTNQRYVSTPSNQYSLGRLQYKQKEDQQNANHQSLCISQKNTLRERLTEQRPQTDFSIKLVSWASKQMGPKFYFVNKQGRRQYNEDRYICKNAIHKSYFKSHLKKQAEREEQMDFYSVFDGHGGSSCAEFLKDNLMTFLIRTKNLDTNPEESLKQAFNLCEQKFLGLCEQRKFGSEKSGACAVSCIVMESKIVVGSVGDCRALMFNKEFMCQMTKDHKPTDTNQKMRILKCGGKVFKEQVRLQSQPGQPIKFFTSTRIAPGNLNVSRTLGDIETKLKKYGGLPGMISAEPDIKTFDKENYEILLLASDGLFEAFTNLQVQKMYYRIAQSEAKNKISNSQLAKKFLDKLIAEALERSNDNITIIVVPLV